MPERGVAATARVGEHLGRAAAIAGVALAVMLLAAPPGWAAKSWNGFVGNQAAAPYDGGAFTAPHGVAIYTGGDLDSANDKILVTEATAFSGHMRVQRLDVDGNFDLAWGGDVVAPGAPGDLGTGFEVCDATVNVPSDCQQAVAGTAEGMFNDPVSIAVNQATGDVYVLDRDNNRVQQFDLDGGFVRAWGWGVDTGANTFEVCTADCQIGIAGSGAGQLGAPPNVLTRGMGIAVSPVAPHDVFVSDPTNQRVLRFGADGIVDGHIGGFGSGFPLRITVDGDGVVYASDAAGEVARYDSATDTPLAPLDSTLLGSGTTVGLTVDASGGHLLVARALASGDIVVREVADPGAELPPSPSPNPAVVESHLVPVEGADPAPSVESMSVDPVSGRIYLATRILRGPPVGIFTGCEIIIHTSCNGLIVLADGTTPSASGVSASDIGATSASVSGSANPSGGIAKWAFEVSDDGVSWSEGAAPRYMAGTTAKPVAAVIDGLEPNTTYRLRLRVSKQVGMASTNDGVSGEQVLLTDAVPPDIRTLGSARRTSSSAVLRARVDPQGAPTSYRFEYGPAGGSFDHHVPVPDATAGAGNQPLLFTQQIDGLLPDTAYHYRVVAENFAGEAVGDTVTFKTAAAAPGPPGLGDRAFELVSPVDKIGGQGVGEWYEGLVSHTKAGIAAYLADRFAVSGDFGAVLVDSAYGYATDWALAERTGGGWLSQPAMNRQAHGHQAMRFLTPFAATDDLSLTTWGSSGGLLRLFEEMQAWPDIEATFVRDWAGRWEVFGPTDLAQLAVSSTALERPHAIADDGSLVVGSSRIRGLAGPEDPTLDTPGLVTNVYVDDVSAGLSDSFPGAGVRGPANVCTAGTVLPDRLGSGKLGERPCPAPDPGRDARLVDSRGAAISSNAVRVVSEDGRRVFFMAPDPRRDPSNDPCSGSGASTECPPQLFVRQRNADGSYTTRWIARSEVSGQDASLLAPVSFEGASADGDKVLLRTATPLTADDPNGGSQVPGGVTSGTPDPSSVDLFVYDFPDDPGADPAAGDLTRISAGPDGDGDPNVSPGSDPVDSGAVRFASADASRVYFITAAPLPGVPPADDGTITEPAGTTSSTDFSNLYLYDANLPADERWRFVARLPRSSELGACATTGTFPGGVLIGVGSKIAVGAIAKCVSGTDDGTFVSFWTDGRLTADDPDAVSGDLYGYDATRDDLWRMSAPQGGLGGSYECTEMTAVRCYGDPGFSLGAPANPALGVATAPRVPGDRLAFFQSRSRLVADDTDDAYDVYQWRNGELSLISTGDSDGDGAFYQGNDRSGDSVFFSTLDPLTWQDVDAVMDVYVSRVGGGFQPPAPPTICDIAVGGCQGGGAPEVSAPIDTATPSEGNPAKPRRVALRARGPARKVLRLAARRGVVPLRVRTSGGGRLRVVAKARIAGKVRRVGRRVARLDGAGRSVVRVRLSRPARAALRRGRRIRVVLVLRMAGARPERVAMTLKGRRR